MERSRPDEMATGTANHVIRPAPGEITDTGRFYRWERKPKSTTQRKGGPRPPVQFAIKSPALFWRGQFREETQLKSLGGDDLWVRAET